MFPEDYENRMLEAIYEYNRIPLWIYNEKLKPKKSYFTVSPSAIAEKLSSHIDQTILKIANPDFDILSYENELYYCFSFRYGKERYYLMGGPILISGFFHPAVLKSLSFASRMNIKELEALAEMLPVLSLTPFCSALRTMMLLLKKEAPNIEEISNYRYSSLQDSLQRTFVHELFENREEDREHTPYSQELAILHCVREGNVEQLKSTFKALPETKYGNMSSNPLRQLFYGCIAATTLVTRYAIEGGMEEEAAFTLSDVYIKKMENCRTLFELNLLNEKMAVDFTLQVAKAKAAKQPVYSEPVSKCMEYIFLNIHNRISLDSLSKEVNLTPKYLSWLFHRETGMTLSAFIEEKRIQEAKNLLIYSNYSYNQISNYLSFNSQSYFISVFKKNTGITPKEYRRSFSRSSWEVKK